MEVVVERVLPDCRDHVIWLSRSATFQGKRFKSGSCANVQQQVSPLTRTAAKIRVGSLSQAADVTLRLGPEQDGLSCALTASVARSLNCKEGDTVIVNDVFLATAVPRAKTVHMALVPIKLGVAQGKGSGRTWDVRHTASSGAVLRQAALGNYVTVGQQLGTLLVAESAYSVLRVEGYGKQESCDVDVGMVDQNTVFVVKPPTFTIEELRSGLRPRETWVEEIVKEVPGTEKVSRRLIDNFYGYVDSLTAVGYRNLKHKRTSGVIIHGKPGVGKTLLSKMLAERSGLPYKYINCADLFQFSEGDAEVYFHDLFDNNPGVLVVLILDDIDAIGSKAGKSESRMAAKILPIFMSILDARNNPPQQQPPDSTANSDVTSTPSAGGVFVICLTNRLHTINPSLLRSGRLNNALELDVINARQRFSILQKLCEALPLSPTNKTEILEAISDVTHGFVGADLQSLCHTTVFVWQQRNPSTDTLALEDFLRALELVKPASFQELSSRVPKRAFTDLYGMGEVIKRIQNSILQPFTHLESYAAMGINPPKGVLLHGPPGVGKSVLSYALVHEAGFNCVHVDGPKIRSKVIGESEANIARIFAQARANAPCILLIDQIDMLVPRRGMDSTSENTGERIVTCFLVEMDGVLSKSSAGGYNDTIFIVAVTNRPEIVDPAILRPGRLDEHIHVGPPGLEARREVYSGFLATMPNTLTEEDVDELSRISEGYTGGDIESICREAALRRLRIDLDSQQISKQDVLDAMGSVRKSVVVGK
ncbi:P-loop containing nucleoside triphosphate hydrolase protein [Fimicolochytrium jonesii]|uniref:P-loop containing nucleoside triphosphate hydrolase protein n=1 Tax=Fimicolochytrium jonesii TaxID=1396493 RepID=UPI0022FEE934|nr:P-loop containing nucleoside triphosphate hydrolase protein [Fimicolochytrium jonesii]KAI8826793.1 P-loop containing nucleoside triphosphate hydrolase protein [Fimicolochytrium jonesii]